MHAPNLLPSAPAPSDASIAVLLIGLACRGGAHLLKAPARARLDGILVEAGVPAGTDPRSAAPQLLAYLEGLDVDAPALQGLESMLLSDIEQDRRRARRACGRLLGASAPVFASRTAAAPKGTLRVADMAPPRRLR